MLFEMSDERLRFIEDTFDLGRIGDGSFDATSPSLLTSTVINPAGNTPKLILDADTRN